MIQEDIRMRIFLIAIMAFLSLAYAENIKTIDLPALPDNTLKPGKGKELVETYCSICHSVNYITIQKKLPRKIWEMEVKKMIMYGTPIENEEEIRTIINYLVENYGARD